MSFPPLPSDVVAAETTLLGDEGEEESPSERDVSSPHGSGRD